MERNWKITGQENFVGFFFQIEKSTGREVIVMLHASCDSVLGLLRNSVREWSLQPSSWKAGLFPLSRSATEEHGAHCRSTKRTIL